MGGRVEKTTFAPFYWHKYESLRRNSIAKTFEISSICSNRRRYIAQQMAANRPMRNGRNSSISSSISKIVAVYGHRAKGKAPAESMTVAWRRPTIAPRNRRSRFCAMSGRLKRGVVRRQVRSSAMKMTTIQRRWRMKWLGCSTKIAARAMAIYSCRSIEDLSMPNWRWNVENTKSRRKY